MISEFEVYLKASPIIKSQQEVPSYDLNIHCDDVDNANPTVIVNQVVNMTNAVSIKPFCYRMPYC